MLRSLPERQALNYAAVRPRGLNLMLSLSSSMSDAIPVALGGLIRSRALVLDEIAARQATARSASERTDPARLALASAQQRIANLMVRGPGELSPAQYASLVEGARRDSENAELLLAERSSEFKAQLSRAHVGLDEVTGSLPADAALVSFVRYERTPFAPFVQQPSPNPSTRPPSRSLASYVAFVLRHGTPPAIVPLGPAQTLDILVSRWREDIAAEVLPSVQTPSGASVPSSRRSGVALRRLVWDRLAAHVGDARRVFIVPDGALGLVPFAALPVGERLYLLETGPVIHYLSAERDLLPLQQGSATRRGLFALGGPSFDDRSLFKARSKATPTLPAPQLTLLRRRSADTCGSLETASFLPLNGTLQEVRDLAALWKANPTTESEPTQVLVGHDAGEARFKRDAPGHRVLHLATHGFFMNGTCPSGPSGTRAVGGLSPGRVKPSVDNPLLLSGLALAGANRRALAGPDEDDGILTAEEVASLDLEGVEWAVLSACDTGVGEIKAGEGILGLRRAFQIAGARTVIMSLWSVDDQATRAWMRLLYEARFQQHLSTADAVHQATVRTLQARRALGQSTHPFYWAAFVAAGDWN